MIFLKVGAGVMNVFQAAEHLYRSCIEYCHLRFMFSKKSPTGPTERTPKPEYLITLATYLGVSW